MFNLRFAESSDFEFFVSLMSDAETAGRSGERHRALARTFAQQPFSIVEVGARPVGVLSVAWDEEPARLHALRLARGMRGRGLGTRIVASVLARARQEARTVLAESSGAHADAFLRRLGFFDEEEGRALRWEPTHWDRTERALVPWTDPARAVGWLRRWFHVGSPEQAEFDAFALSRGGLVRGARILVSTGTADIDLEPMLTTGMTLVIACAHADVRDALHRRWSDETGTVRVVEALPDERFDGGLSLDGGPGSEDTHAAREEALGDVAARLEPGAPLVVDHPHVPWMLAHELAPLPESSNYYEATLTRMIERTLRLHEGRLVETEQWFVETAGIERFAHALVRSRTIVTRSALLEALDAAGIGHVETFAHPRARHVGATEGRHLLVVGQRT